MSELLYRVSLTMQADDLSRMVLAKEDLPGEMTAFELARDGELDNETMADHSFPGSTTEEIRATGRISGYLSEFVNTDDRGLLSPPEEGHDLVAATVVHLFNDMDEVDRWMTNKFLGEFKAHVGRDLGRGQQLIRADELDFDGFADKSVGLHTLQTSDFGLVSSTVVDFRVGRLLGVAYLVTAGDVERRDQVRELGALLERRIVKTLLGSN